VSADVTTACSRSLYFDARERHIHRVFLPFGQGPERMSADTGIPYLNYRSTKNTTLSLSPDKNFGSLSLDGGSDGDTKRRVFIYNLQNKIDPVCLIEFHDFSAMPADFARNIWAKVSVHDGICVVQASTGANVEVSHFR
jgi:hypothetical protein